MEATKKCTGCGRVLPLSEFHKNCKMKDGHSYRCKECVKQTTRAWYQKNKEYAKRKAKEYRAKNPEKVLEARLINCKRDPSSKRAYKAVEAALDAGALVKPDVCSGCGCTSDEHRIEAHHYDYSKPLDVIWLCTPCHRRMDARRRMHEGLESEHVYSETRLEDGC